MAKRRMFSLDIVDSDAFLEMPATSQLLYFHLSMRGDDDGFVNSPKKIMKIIGSSEDDMKLLIAKKFIIPFDSGIVVIKHWRIHNYIQADRYIETKYKEEKSKLLLDENKSYTMPKPLENADFEPCIQNGYKMDTQVRLGKVRLGKGSIEIRESKSPKNIIPPTQQMVTEYCIGRHNQIDPQQFFDFYETKGWKVGKEKMKDWQACIRTWEKRETKKGGNSFIGTLSEYED